MATQADRINFTVVIEELRTERDLLRRTIEANGANAELVRRFVTVEDRLIDALQARRRRAREEVTA